MRSLLIIIALCLSACVSEPLPAGFKGSNDFDPISAAKNRISLGLTYLNNGNYSQAKFNLDKALQFAPRYADAHFSMAYYYQQVDELNLADEAYKKALAFAPKNADIANSYGAFLCENGKYDEAKTYFLKAVNSSNYISTAETYENLALCSLSQGEVSDALTYVKSSLNHQPSRAKSLLLLVELQMQDENWPQAKQALRRYERVSNVSADTLWKSIEIEKALGNFDVARGFGDMLVRMYPKHPNTYQYIKQRNAIIEQQAVDTSNRLELVDDHNISALNVTPVTTPEPTIVPPQPASISNTPKTEGVQQDDVAKTHQSTASSLATTRQFHVVEKGDNLYRISLKYNVKMKKLIEWNQLDENAAIVIGMKLLVVEPEVAE